MLSGYEEQTAPAAPAVHDPTNTFYAFLQESTIGRIRETIRTEEEQLKTKDRTSDNTHDPFILRLSNDDVSSTSCVTLRPQLLLSGHPNDTHRAQ